VSIQFLASSLAVSDMGVEVVQQLIVLLLLLPVSISDDRILSSSGMNQSQFLMMIDNL
jgi:hypothetical protein